MLIRSLNQVDPHVGSTAVVTIHGKQRHKYLVSASGYIRTVLVYDKKLIHSVMLFVDPYWLNYSYGLQAKFTDLQCDHNTETAVRFFRVIQFKIYNSTNEIGSVI